MTKKRKPLTPLGQLYDRMDADKQTRMAEAVNGPINLTPGHYDREEVKVIYTRWLQQIAAETIRSELAGWTIPEIRARLITACGRQEGREEAMICDMIRKGEFDQTIRDILNTKG